MPAFTPQPQNITALLAGTHFTVPQRVEGWVDLGGWLHTEIKCRPGVEPSSVTSHYSYSLGFFQNTIKKIYFHKVVPWILVCVPCPRSTSAHATLICKYLAYSVRYMLSPVRPCAFVCLSLRHRSTCWVQISWHLADGKSVKSCVADLTKNSPGSPAITTPRIAHTICQLGLYTMYSESEFSRFHPKRFTFGGIIAERVNTAKHAP